MYAIGQMKYAKLANNLYPGFPTAKRKTEWGWVRESVRHPVIAPSGMQPDS